MNFLQAFDQGFLYFFSRDSLNLPWLITLARRVTRLGDPASLFVAALEGVLLLLLFRRHRAAGALALTSLLGWGLDVGFKDLVARPRPNEAWRRIDRPSGPGFPSGHALNSMSIYGGLALLLSREARRPWRRRGIIAVGIGLGLAIGLTRPYLGVHYPLDVLGGWFAGLACALLAYVLAGPLPEPIPPPPSELTTLPPPAASEKITERPAALP
jgi:undecaprenyl-diphosphatase